MQALPPPRKRLSRRVACAQGATGAAAFSACACGAPIPWAPRTARLGWLSLGAGTQPVAFGLGKQALGVLG